MSEMIIEGVTDEISSLQLTSKDFYWDGYSHFRTHEVSVAKLHFILDRNQSQKKKKSKS